MKLILFSLVTFLIPLILKQDNKTDLLCQKWRNVGIKSFGKEFTPVEKSLSEVILINKDGSFEQDVAGSLHFKGQWKYSTDSTKLGFAITEMNGTLLPNLSIEDTKPTDSILKLTKDSLIYGTLSYNGPSKIYGYDTWYFVREK